MFDLVEAKLSISGFGHLLKLEMQTKTKFSGRNSSRKLASPVSKNEKKDSENAEIQDNKVSELITSSVRKQRGVPKKIVEDIAATHLNMGYGMVDDDTSAACLGYDANHDTKHASIDHMGHEDGIRSHMAETIFSPTFHVSRSVGGEITTKADFFKFFHKETQKFQDCGDETLLVDLLNSRVMQDKNSDKETMTSMNLTCPDLGGGLPSEVSAMYASMKNSKGVCVDEYNQDHMSTDVCMEDDDCKEFDDFDPYLFIKNLPDLLSVVPTFRPVLLPKQTRRCPPTTLVLDLDETLVHSTLEPCDDADFTFTVNFNLEDHAVFVRCRPYLKDFLERVSGHFEIVIFTASQSIYAEQLLNVLDPKRKIFRHRVYRQSCVFVEGNYLKDLSILGRDLAHVIIIDNSPQAFGFQVDNGIPIESWFDDRSDEELLLLLPFLETLVGVQDVRPLIAKKFNLRKKIAAAVIPLNYNRDPFER